MTPMKAGRRINEIKWILKDQEGNKINTFRCKKVAMEEKARLEFIHLKEFVLEEILCCP